MFTQNIYNSLFLFFILLLNLIPFCWIEMSELDALRTFGNKALCKHFSITNVDYVYIISRM